MLTNNGIDYNPLLTYEAPFIYNIGQDAYVTTQKFFASKKEYYDVILHLKDREIFLGRFQLELNDLRIAYKNGKILIYYDEFNHTSKRLEIVKVLGLYDIVDDVFISSKEREALEAFDTDLYCGALKTPEKYTYRSDVQKKAINSQYKKRA